jgi:hypothetical protein
MSALSLDIRKKEVGRKQQLFGGSYRVRDNMAQVAKLLKQLSKRRHEGKLVASVIPYGRNLAFLDRSRYFFSSK